MRRHLTLILATTIGSAAASAQNISKADIPVRTAATQVLAELTNVDIDWTLPAAGTNRLYYSAGDTLYLLNVTSKQSTLVAVGEMWNADISPRRDRLVFSRTTEDRKSANVWVLSLDEKTGLATGPAHRLGIARGDESRFSPDGKWVAFAQYEQPHDSGERLMVVPADGGPGHEVTKRYGGIGMIQWTPDGQTLHFSAYEQGFRQFVSYQVGLKGGRVDSLATSYVQATPGLSPDGKYTAVAEVPSMYLLTDAAGKKIARVPVNRTQGGWSGIFWDSPTSLAVLSSKRRNGIEAVPIDGGTPVELLSADLSPEVPSWSPDGKRIATFAHRNGKRVLLVLDASGRVQREYSAGVEQTCCFYELTLSSNREIERSASQSLAWSPDGRFIAFHGPPAGKALRVIELADGSVHDLGRRTNDVNDGQYRWRSDSRALMYTPQGATVPWAIHEVTLAGDDRVLLDRLPAGRPWGMRDDTTAVFDGDSGVFVVKLSTKKWTQISKSLGYPAASDRALTMFAVRTSANKQGLDYLDRAGTPRGSLNPSGLYVWDALFTPDGQKVVFRAGAHGHQAIYVEPVSGGTPHKLFDYPRNSNEAYMEISPDGRRLLFTNPGVKTSIVSRVDLAPILGGSTAKR